MVLTNQLNLLKLLCFIILFSSIAFSEGNRGRQYETIKGHLKKIKNSNDDFEITISYIDLSYDFINFDTDSALIMSDSAIHYSKINDNFKLAKAYAIRGEILRRTAHYDSALFYQNLSLSLRNADDMHGFRYNYIEIGDVYKEQGKYLLANVYYIKAMDVVREFGKSIGLKYHNDLKKLNPVLYDFLFAQKDKGQLKIELNKLIKKYNLDPIGEIHAYIYNYLEVNQRIADIDYLYGKYNESLKRNSEIKEIFELNKVKGKYNYVSLSFEYYFIEYAYKIGRDYLALNQIDSAFHYANLAFNIAATRPDSIILARSNRLLGDIEYLKGNLSNFKKYYNKSISIFKNLKMESEVAKIISFYALKSLDLENFDDKELNKEIYYALGLIKNKNNLKIEADLNKAQYLYYKHYGNVNLALFFLERKLKLNDSIFNMDFTNKVIEQQEVLEVKRLKEDMYLKDEELESITDKYEQSVFYLLFTGIVIVFIGILYYNNNKSRKKIKKYNNQLIEQSDKIKEIGIRKQELISLLAHDIKSPVLLTSKAIQLMKTKDLDKIERDDYISQIDDSLQRLNILIQNVLVWVNSEEDELEMQLVQVDLFDFLSDKLLEFNRLFESKNIELDLNIGEVNIIIEELSFEIILNNIINNAIKFADFNSKFSIILEDNLLKFINIGKEFDLSQVEDFKNEQKTYPKLGTNNEKGTGLGLRIISNLCKKNNILFDIESNGKESKIILNLSEVISSYGVN